MNRKTWHCALRKENVQLCKSLKYLWLLESRKNKVNFPWNGRPQKAACCKGYVWHLHPFKHLSLHTVAWRHSQGLLFLKFYLFSFLYLVDFLYNRFKFIENGTAVQKDPYTDWGQLLSFFLVFPLLICYINMVYLLQVTIIIKLHSLSLTF